MRLSLRSLTANTLDQPTNTLVRTGYPSPTDETQDSLLFRLGHYKYLNVNMDDMLLAFKPHSAYEVDLVFNWEDQRVAVWINSTLTKTVNFFYKPPGNEEQEFYHKINGTDVLYLYNLSPGTRCDFEDLQMCDEVCAGTNETIVFKDSAVLAAVSALMLIVSSLY